MVQSDLKGSIPSQVTNLVSQSQPMIVGTISKLLATEQNKDGVSFVTDFEYMPSYDGM